MIDPAMQDDSAALSAQPQTSKAYLSLLTSEHHLEYPTNCNLTIPPVLQDKMSTETAVSQTSLQEPGKFFRHQPLKHSEGSI